VGAAPAQVRLDSPAADALLASLAAGADRALDELADLAPALSSIRAAQLLTERAALSGDALPPRSCRLLEAADGWIALNLARDDDWTSLPAWLEADIARDWNALASAVRTRAADELVERGRVLGLALTRADRVPEQTPWFRVHARGPVAAPSARPVVVELASLWAGPLAGRLLRLAGADVIKVESRARPDGARRGSPEFFERLNAGKRSVTLDLDLAAGREELRALLENADIVIEGSRPRALRQLGIDAEAMVAARAGLTWISITGYGRAPPHDQWIAYGDDAAIAAGLSQRAFEAGGERGIVGDAVADPLTGVHAALAALSFQRRGGGALIDIALRDVVAHLLSA
jgi:hypothetical protein